MKISRELLDQLVSHVLEDPANEICGVVAIEANGAAAGHRRAVHVYRARNIHLSPLRFEIDPNDLLRLSNEIDERGWEIGAIYHSHVRSEPAPSQTDINYAANWPGVEWIIVGLASGPPDVRSYLIEEGQVGEVPLEVH
jgi:proteasome lid subunit RPN8/RPN11